MPPLPDSERALQHQVGLEASPLNKRLCLFIQRCRLQGRLWQPLPLPCQICHYQLSCQQFQALASNLSPVLERFGPLHNLVMNLSSALHLF